MKKMLIGLIAAMALVWVVQAQAAEVVWHKDVKPLFDRVCLPCHGKDSPEHDAFAKDKKELLIKVSECGWIPTAI